MRVKFSGLTGPCIGILFGLVLAFNLGAQNKAPKPPKIMNVQGRVEMIDKGTSAITVAKGNIKRTVVYSGDTKFLYGHSKSNKPGASDQVKEGWYISCSGPFNAKTQLEAQTCVYREAQ
ncbi:exported hypothetical protein [Candidatus Sulfopaludibacter sp. SbA6]|nr:exported hypothetical protein [Candidatus Sulfopaludibacter sp. SbA6]